MSRLQERPSTFQDKSDLLFTLALYATATPSPGAMQAHRARAAMLKFI